MASWNKLGQVRSQWPTLIIAVNGPGVLGADLGPKVTFYTNPSDGGTTTAEHPSVSETRSNGQSGTIRNDLISLTANPEQNYRFSNWQISG